MYEMSIARAENKLQKPTWRRAQRVTLSVLVNEMQDCTTEPITGSLLSSNSQQLLCTGFVPPQQDIFQLMLLQMPDRINRGCVWRSLAEKSRCGPRTKTPFHKHTHTYMVYVYYICIYLLKASHPLSSVTICCLWPSWQPVYGTEPEKYESGHNLWTREKKQKKSRKWLS